MVNIDLASFSFDTSEILAGAALIKKNIDELKAAQAELVKAGQGSSEQFVQNAADLKTLNGYYNEHVKALSESSKGAFDAATREQQLNLVLGQEVTTIAGLRDQNKLLNKLRNDTNIKTDEGKEELKLLNEQLDRNNALIKANVDQYAQQKIGIGDYASGIKSALADMNPFNVSLSVFIQNAQQAGGVMPLLSNGLAAVRTGIVGITRASLAFIATPIGAVIAAVGVTLGLIVNYLKSTQAGMDAVTKVTRPLVAIFESFVGVLQNVGKSLFEAFSNPKKLLSDLAEFVKTNLINRFKAFGVILDGLVNLDFKKVADGVLQAGTGVENMTDKIGGAAKATGKFLDDAIQKGLELDRLEKELEKTRIRNTVEIGKASEEFKSQNKIAEDTNKTLAQREAAVVASIVAAENINRLKQQELDLEIAILKNRQSRNDTTREEQQQLAELIAKKNELNAQELEMTTTQQNKLNTIRKEAQDKANAAAEKALDARLKREEEKIALYEQQQNDGRAKTLAQELEIEQNIAKMRMALLNEELKAKRVSQLEYAREVLAIQQDVARKQAEVAVEAAGRELEAYKRTFEAQMHERQFLSDAVAAKKVEELNALLAKEQEFAALRLEQGLINQQEYDDAIFELTEANKAAAKAITDEREAVRKQEAEQLRALEFEAEMQRMLEEGATRFEIQQAQISEQFDVEKAALDASLADKAISQELYDAKLAKLRADKTKAEVENEKILAEEKFKLATDIFDAAAAFIDKDSKAGKAIAAAKAGINMYQGISAGVALGFPQAIPAVAFAAATGIKAIKDIMATKIPSAKGSGSVGGGGGGFTANLATNLTGQGVSIPTNNAAVQTQVEQNAATAGMADQVAAAVQQGAAQGTAQGSQQGITNLSSNRQIMEQSGF